VECADRDGQSRAYAMTPAQFRMVSAALQYRYDVGLLTWADYCAIQDAIVLLVKC
jgi:hypothetical protein